MDELPERDLFDGPKLLRGLLLKNSFSLGISKRLNHELIVYRYSIKCKTDVAADVSTVLLCSAQAPLKAAWRKFATSPGPQHTS
jgi:hypothetical protein